MLTDNRRRIVLLALWVGVAALLVTAAVGVPPWAVLLVTVVALGALALVRRRQVRRLIVATPARSFALLGFGVWVPLALALGIWLFQAAGDAEAGASASDVVASAVAVVLLLLAHGVLAFSARYNLNTLPFVINVPEARETAAEKGLDLLDQGVVLLFAAGLVLFVLPVFGAESWTVVVAVALVLALMIALLVPMLVEGARTARLAQRLNSLQPVFALMHDRQSTVVSHFKMWRDYFDRSGHPYVQIVVNKGALDELASSGTSVVGLAPRDGTEASVAHIIPKTVRVLFYMRNGGLNRTLVEARPDLTHVFLHHGDGDKPANSRPSHGLHDHILVAGQAAVDRYARRGVSIPAERFRIMGRPQASGFREATEDVGSGTRTVLYAPTWKGMNESVNFSSLLVGPDIVERLVERGCRVIFRPHHLRQDFPPHAQAIARIKEILAESKQRDGVDHIWGEAAEHELTLADVANLSDAMVADVSGVVTDYRQSGKPFAMVSTKMPIEEFREEYPSSESAYVIDASDTGSIDHVLDDMLGPDPLRDLRLEHRDYYLGGFRGNGSVEAFMAYLDELADR